MPAHPLQAADNAIRDAQIRTLMAEPGRTAKEVAAIFRLTTQRVYQIMQQKGAS